MYADPDAERLNKALQPYKAGYNYTGRLGHYEHADALDDLADRMAKHSYASSAAGHLYDAARHVRSQDLDKAVDSVRAARHAVKRENIVTRGEIDWSKHEQDVEAALKHVTQARTEHYAEQDRQQSDLDWNWYHQNRVERDAQRRAENVAAVMVGEQAEQFMRSPHDNGGQEPTTVGQDQPAAKMDSDEIRKAAKMDSDEYEIRKAMAGNDWAYKVGPHGYIHGWIKVDAGGQHFHGLQVVGVSRDGRQVTGKYDHESQSVMHNGTRVPVSQIQLPHDPVAEQMLRDMRSGKDTRAGHGKNPPFDPERDAREQGYGPDEKPPGARQERMVPGRKTPTRGRFPQHMGTTPTDKPLRGPRLVRYDSKGNPVFANPGTAEYEQAGQ